jgi:hypothetical protein
LYENNWNAFHSYWSHVSARGLRLVDFNVRAASGAGFNDGGSEFENADRDDVEETVLLDSDVSDRTEEASSLVQLGIYPNPATDVLTLESDKDILSWSLVSANGSILQRVTEPGATQKTMIQVSSLPTGVYYLMVQTAAGIEKRKVEVLK